MAKAKQKQPSKRQLAKALTSCIADPREPGTFQVIAENSDRHYLILRAREELSQKSPNIPMAVALLGLALARDFTFAGNYDKKEKPVNARPRRTKGPVGESTVCEASGVSIGSNGPLI